MPNAQRLLPPLFPYQKYAVDKLVGRGGKGCLFAPPGAGKTRTAITVMQQLGILPEGTILILCSGPAIATWKRQLPQWDPRVNKDDVLIVRGKPHDRAKMWSEILYGTGASIAVTNYSVFLRDFEWIRKIGWDAILADEYHKTMRRRQSKTFKRFRTLTRHIKCVIPMTGSIMSKDPSSMWTGFAIAEPKVWSSYWRFVNTFCIINEGPFGKDILGPRNLQALREVTDRYHAYIPEKVVADQLPEGSRQGIHVEMDWNQKGMYENIQKEMYHVGDDGTITIASTAMHQLLLLRQLLCCPRILDETATMGAGYEYIVDTLEEEDHVIIFVPFREACLHIARDLIRRGHKNTFIYRGQMTEEERARALDGFRETRGILVCTIASAESFDAETCRTSWFLGYDFHVDPNRQAEGRTRRAISEHKFVKWNYIRYDGTIDDYLLEVLNTEQRDINLVLERSDEFIRALLMSDRDVGTRVQWEDEV